jgi:hypothetical protein
MSESSPKGSNQLPNFCSLTYYCSLIAKLVVKKIVTECVQISIKNKIKDFPGTFTEKWNTIVILHFGVLNSAYFVLNVVYVGNIVYWQIGHFPFDVCR